MKYRKKPVTIEAYQTDVELDIPTLEGTMHASVGDYIITGVRGERYPCKPDIFLETYEPAEGGDDGTAGAATCHYSPDDVGFTWWDENDVEHCEEYSASDECCSASCDKCGYTMMVGDDGWFDGWDEITEWWEEDGSYHKGYVLRPRFKHCPNCGAKVVDA